MVATFIGAANAPTSGDSQVASRAVTKPAGAQIGVFFVCLWTGAGGGTITPSGGSGTWVTRDDTTVGETRTATFLKYVDADSTDTTYTFTFGGGSTWSALKAIFFADVDAGLTLTTVPFNAANANGPGYASVSVTTVDGAALAWSGNAAEYGSPPTHTPPTNFTEVGDTDMSVSAYRISPGDGSQTASGASTSGAVARKISTLVAIAPVATGGAVTGTAAGSYGFTGTASGAPTTHGTATGSYGFTGTADGVVSGAVIGTAQGSYGFTGIADGTRHVAGLASGSYGFDGIASGIVSGVITGTAEGDYGFAAVVAGTRSVAAVATGIYGYDGTADGMVGIVGQAGGSYGFTGTATGFTGTPPTTGTASGTYGFTGAAVGDIAISGSAQTTAGFTGTATGDTTVLGQATGNYGITVTALGIVPTEDPNPLLLTYTEPPSRVTYREQSSIVYQEA